MHNLRTSIFAYFFMLLMPLQAAGISYATADSVKVVGLLTKGKRLPAGENLMLFYAEQLKGLPYVAKTLEVNKKEQLVVNLRQLDCTTLIENVVALALTTQQGSTRFDDFCSNLLRIRYQEGKINGYASRNHYFSEWIQSNEQQGIVTEIKGNKSDKRGAYYPFVDTQTIACTYMSKHPDLYPMLKGNAQALKQIKANEQRINGEVVHYVPKRLLARSRNELTAIEDGDILAIVTKKEGLDVAHLGLAVWGRDGQLHLLNASQIHKRVVLEPMTLAQYMQKHPTQLGVRVLRLNDLRK